MKLLTSAAANKLIKSLEDQKSYLLSLESESCTYVMADNERVDPPEYDYIATSNELYTINWQVQKLKHAINIFNTTTILSPLEITIDEALIRMAQLNNRKSQLDKMRRRLPKERQTPLFNRTMTPEYQYVNYDLVRVGEDYKKLCEQINQIQLLLDTCNQTKTFEIDV